jgi:hypothetical protein
MDDGKSLLKLKDVQGFLPVSHLQDAIVPKDRQVAHRK